MDALPLPPTLPPRPDLPVPAGAPGHTRRRQIWLGIGIGVAVAAVLVLIGLAPGDDPNPDSLDGLARIRSSDVETFEEGLGSVSFGGIRLSGAMYGNRARD